MHVGPFYHMSSLIHVHASQVAQSLGCRLLLLTKQVRQLSDQLLIDRIVHSSIQPAQLTDCIPQLHSTLPLHTTLLVSVVLRGIVL